MEININLLPWRINLHKLNQRRFFAAVVALVLNIILGISLDKLFNEDLIKWQHKYQQEKNYLSAKPDSLSPVHKKIVELLHIISSVPKNIYLTQIIFDAEHISVEGVAENYQEITALVQLFKRITYFSKTSLISTEQVGNKFNFKINVDTAI